MVNLYQNKVLATEKKIQEYLEKIGKQKNKKELIGILKLYGITINSDNLRYLYQIKKEGG